MKLTITIPDDKAEEAMALFMEAAPRPNDLTPQGWIERCLADFLKSKIEEGMYHAARRRGLLDAKDYVLR